MAPDERERRQEREPHQGPPDAPAVLGPGEAADEPGRHHRDQHHSRTLKALPGHALVHGRRAVQPDAERIVGRDGEAQQRERQVLAHLRPVEGEQQVIQSEICVDCAHRETGKRRTVHGEVPYQVRPRAPSLEGIQRAAGQKTRSVSTGRDRAGLGDGERRAAARCRVLTPGTRGVTASRRGWLAHPWR